MTPTVVVCARFQPPHRGHVDAITAACASGARVLVVLLGAHESRSLRNPWSESERQAMLAAALPAGVEVEYLALRDRRYDRHGWTRRLEEAVRRRVGPWAQILLVGDRELRSDLPPWPANWGEDAAGRGFIARENLLRALFFWGESAFSLDTVVAHLTPAMAAWQRAFVAAAPFAALREEAAFIRAGKARWASAPYPPIFVTVDALVTWREEVLVIERGRLPGIGLHALPGGFLDPQESLLAACRRELLEETLLDASALAPSAVRVFDDPYRSLRGRTITHLYRFDCPPARPRPRATGGDDARSAAWLARSALEPRRFFEDHYAMLQVMLDLE